jgi:hypothetical protein
VFLSSLAYLPILMIAMVVDRGPISPRAWSDGGRPLSIEIDPQLGVGVPNGGSSRTLGPPATDLP